MSAALAVMLALLALRAPLAGGGPAVETATAAATPPPEASSDARAPWLPAARSGDSEVRWRRELALASPATRIAFIGDSIFENWRTDGAVNWAGTLAPLGALDLGVGGDRTENTLWRIEQGELDAIAPQVTVVLIGTNDLDRWTPEETAHGVVAVVAAIRAKLPDTHIVLLAILPRDGSPIAPLRARARAVNAIIRETDYGPNVTYRDVGATVTNLDGTLRYDAYQDGHLHLSEAGYERLAAAIAPSLAAP